MIEKPLCDIEGCDRRATRILWDTWYDEEMHVCRRCFDSLAGHAGFEEERTSDGHELLRE